MKSFNFTYNDILSKAAHSLYTQISQLDNGKIPAQNSLYRNNQIIIKDQRKKHIHLEQLK